MPLDIYLVKNHEAKKHLISINLGNSILWDSLWAKLQKYHGLSVDPYGTTRLYSNHILIILKFLNEYFKDEPQLLQFKKAMEDIKLERDDIILFEGD